MRLPSLFRSHLLVKITFAVATIFVLISGSILSTNYMAHRIEKKIVHIPNLKIVSTQPSLPTSFLSIFNEKGPYPAMNILVLGSDTRTGQGSGFGNVAGARSDTVMLFHVNAARTTATEISFPRDLWVPLPDCASNQGGTNNKLNSAFAYGGVACTTTLISQLTGLNIDHVVIVDFKGFEGVVNAIGGLNVCLAQPVNDVKAEVNLPAGQQLINGKQALGLARARYSLADGSDLQRIKRQQALVKLAIKQVKSSGIFTNPKRLYDLISAGASSLSVDPTLTTLPQLAGLAWQMKDISLGQIQTITVPYVRDADGNFVIDPTLATTIFDDLKSDTPIPGSPKIIPSPSASASIPVLINQNQMLSHPSTPPSTKTLSPSASASPTSSNGSCYPPIF